MALLRARLMLRGCRLRCLLLRALFLTLGAIQHVRTRDIMLARAHQRELDLVLYIFDMEGAAGRLATNHRSHDHLRQLLDELACEGKALLVVSSELPELLGICDRIYTLSAGVITADVPREQADQELLMRYMTQRKAG